LQSRRNKSSKGSIFAHKSVSNQSGLDSGINNQKGGSMDKVVHFEIPFDRKNRATRFYAKIFGWTLAEIPEMDYVMAYAAKTDKNHMVKERGAINGGMFPRTKAAKAPIIVIGVASIQKTIKKVVAAGGKVITPKQSIPGGSYARIADSEGNVIGLADSSK
jgi:uncharacterized protein